MLRTYKSLTQAIDDNDLAEVQRILADRDPQGVPYTDINTSRLGTTALLYAVTDYHSRTRVEILLALLEVRDNNNNPVININATNIDGRTVLHWILRNSYYTDREKTLLVDRIINLRGAQGQLMFHAQSDTSFLPPLFCAAEKKH